MVNCFTSCYNTEEQIELQELPPRPAEELNEVKNDDQPDGAEETEETEETEEIEDTDESEEPEDHPTDFARNDPKRVPVRMRRWKVTRLGLVEILETIQE